MTFERATVTYQPKTPILLLAFNRIHTTKQVFQAIRLARPSRLYVAADGARAEIPGEVEKVQAVRNHLTSTRRANTARSRAAGVVMTNGKQTTTFPVPNLPR